MSGNDINGLRDVLFDTLRKLKAGQMDVDKAKAINDTAQTIINTAKVEVEHMKIAGGTGSSFIPAQEPHRLPGKEATPTATGVKVVSGNVTTHRLRG